MVPTSPTEVKTWSDIVSPQKSIDRLVGPAKTLAEPPKKGELILEAPKEKKKSKKKESTSASSTSSKEPSPIKSTKLSKVTTKTGLAQRRKAMEKKGFILDGINIGNLKVSGWSGKLPDTTRKSTYYVVWRGVKCGIFEDWETTWKYTSGYPSTGYKKVVGGQLEAFLLLEKNSETVI